jgi:hypothetical protein
MKDVKKFSDFKLNENNGNNNDFIINRINSIISDKEKVIQNNRISIDILNEIINKEFVLLYDSFDSIENIKFDDFKRKFNLGKIINEFYDPYDSLKESYISIFENFIVWSRRDYKKLYISLEEQKRLTKNKFNL